MDYYSVHSENRLGPNKERALNLTAVSGTTSLDRRLKDDLNETAFASDFC